MNFKAKIEKIESKGGWHYVLIPDEVRVELQKQAGKRGSIPVLVTVGKSSWPSTTMSMGNQRWFIAVKSEIRKTEKLKAGDGVEVKILPDLYRLQ